LFPDSFPKDIPLQKIANFTDKNNYSLLPLQKTDIMYPIEIVQPMKEELTENGFKELMNGREVEAQLQQQGTTLIMINSVCGCSAGTARPGVLMAVANAAKKPDHLATSFAGFDTEAVQTLRQHLILLLLLPLLYSRMENWCISLNVTRLKAVLHR
jgi:hypothetical protein